MLVNPKLATNGLISTRVESVEVEKLWCSWQMRQSAQPVIEPTSESVVLESEADAVDLVDEMRPCRCAISTVDP
jgi:hypothetical protein